MILFASEITAREFKGRMGDPRAVRDRLSDAGCDEVALAGASDVPWPRLLGLLEPAMGHWTSRRSWSYGQH